MELDLFDNGAFQVFTDDDELVFGFAHEYTFKIEELKELINWYFDWRKREILSDAY